MKRALLPLVAAVILTLAACGSDSGDASSPAASSSSGSSSSGSSSSGSSSSGSTTSSSETSAPSAASVNDQVREACQNGVAEKLPGATFPNPGTLRVASSPDGKQYTVTGTAQVAGAPHSYTCGVLAGADKVEVTEVTAG
jgi:hypothetical protein